MSRIRIYHILADDIYRRKSICLYLHRKGEGNMSLSVKFEKLHMKRGKLEDMLHSIGKKERTLEKELKILEEKLAIRQLEEKLRERAFPILCGEKAIWALRDFIDEIEEQRGKELLAKQADALIGFANGLILSIKEDMSPMHKPMEWYARPEIVRSLYLS